MLGRELDGLEKIEFHFHWIDERIRISSRDSCLLSLDKLEGLKLGSIKNQRGEKRS